jgi:hypothetical protein
MDYVQEAERHRYMAEEYRTLSDKTPHDALRTHYRKLAETYQALAADEDKVASNLKVKH